MTYFQTTGQTISHCLAIAQDSEHIRRPNHLCAGTEHLRRPNHPRKARQELTPCIKKKPILAITALSYLTAVYLAKRHFRLSSLASSCLLIPLFAAGAASCYNLYKAGKKFLVIQRCNRPVALVTEDIQELQRKNPNLKIGLLIGRTPPESLPQEKNWLWVSGDFSLGYCSGNCSGQMSPKRIHLKMDFAKDSEEMRTIANLFNKVIVDYSTLKALQDVYHLPSLLKKEKESTLIFGCYSTRNLLTLPPCKDKDQVKIALDNQREETRKEQAKQVHEKFGSSFGSIQEFIRDPYPYRQGPEHPAFPSDYFVLTDFHPKE